MERNEKKIAELHPVVRPYAQEFIARLEQLGMKPLITQGYRTVEEQNQLYAQGRTRPGQKVTNARGGESFHNYRLAFDLAFLDNKGALTYDVDWSIVGKMGQQCGLEWGGAWVVFKDKPHFQLVGSLKIKELYKNPSASQLVDLALAPYTRQFNAVSKWAKDAVDKAMAKGIEVWTNPQEPVTPEMVEQVFYKLGYITEVRGGMTKERLMVALMNAKIL